jgi:kinesin family protein C2/C3
LGPAKKQIDTAELQKVKQMVRVNIAFSWTLIFLPAWSWPDGIYFWLNVCQLERSKQEARLKDDSLKKLEENCQNLENKAKGKEQLYKSLQEKVPTIEANISVSELWLFCWF